jgi:hypothetical protein
MIRPIYTHPIKGKTVAGLVFLHCCASSVPSKRVEWSGCGREDMTWSLSSLAHSRLVYICSGTPSAQKGQKSELCVGLGVARGRGYPIVLIIKF